MPGLKQKAAPPTPSPAAKLGWLALLIICLLVMAGAGVARAHGVELFVEDRPTVQVRVAYADGEPMSYAEVLIHAPDDAERAFQRGRTDRSGRFAFVPSVKGSWRMVVSDGMGHRIEKTLVVKDIKTGGGVRAPSSSGLSKFWKVLVGLSLIAGIFGLAALFWAYRRSPGRGAT